MKVSEKYRIAFLDQLHPKIYDAIRESLPKGWSASFASSRDAAEQESVVRDAEIIIVIGAPVRRSLIQAAPKLKIIQKLGAGVDNIDKATCSERGIAIARLSGGNAIPVAEHTVMMILAALRRLPEIDRRTRAGDWIKEEARGIHRQLSGKCVGLLGFGAIGKAVAKALSGFDVTIQYYDPIQAPKDIETALGVRYLGLDDLVASSDIISLHLPLTPETANILNADRVKRMKPDAVVVNCARGGLVDETALRDALLKGHLFAVALDAFSEEPPKNNPLLSMDRTVVTSHLAGATLDNFSSVLKTGLDNVQRFLRGEGLPRSDVVFSPPNAPIRES